MKSNNNYNRSCAFCGMALNINYNWGLGKPISRLLRGWGGRGTQ